jgi:hypothetical protein
MAVIAGFYYLLVECFLYEQYEFLVVRNARQIETATGEPNHRKTSS